MKGQTTTIANPDNPEDIKKFSFDHSYWSHDGAEKLESGYFKPKDGTSYIGQVSTHKNSEKIIHLCKTIGSNSIILL